MNTNATSESAFHLGDLQSWSTDIRTGNRRLMSVVAVVLALVFGFGGVWAATAPLGGAVVTSGRVIAQGRNIAVQNLEGGILARILAAEGQAVVKGELLAEMDTTSVLSQLQRVRVDRAISMIELARWRSERDGTELDSSIGDLGELGNHARVREAFESQFAEFSSGRQAFAQKLRGIDGQIRNEEQDLIYLQTQISQTETQIKLVGNERGNLGKLQEKGLVSNARVLSLDRELSRLEAERSNVLATIEKSHNNISSLNEEKQQLSSEREVRISEKLTELQKRLTAHEDQVTRLEDILQRSDLTAPVDGVVFNIPAKSVGAVIQPGQTIVEILPSDVSLEMEVQIAPTNIDDMYVDQPVEMVFPSDQEKVRSPLKGKVNYISADAFTSQAGDIRYIARVSLDPDWNGRIILPGMVGEVFFRTEARTLLELLAEPVTRFARRSFED